MIFTETKLAGAYVIEPEPMTDERGYFARTFCAAEFAARGLNASVAQCNVSFNATKGTLRGMHYQVAPHAEAKLVRCTRGAIYDVLVDLRPGSPTYRQWTACELSADNGLMVYAAEGLAHGFQTLEDDTEVYYQMSAPYVAGAGRGVRWDDPGLAINWPLPPQEGRIVSARDQEYKDHTW